MLKNIASPYVYLKNYLTDQHGTINSITWIPTGYRGDLTNPSSSCISIFGGDTYICRHTLKRKHSQFLSTAMKQADLTPFNYFFYNNIGRNPKFWLSYELDKDFDSKGKLFPDIVTEKSFDVDTKGGNYYRPPSRFYLYHYGVPSFLCESRINTNFRYGGKELKEQFFPQVGDLGEWTQESVVSIREPNVFKYNSVYSKSTASLKQRVLPTSYKKEDSECKSDFPNGVIYSLPDYSENSSFDPWLIYRPNDFYEFPTSYGKLKEMRGIENQQILARFENTTAIFNAVDTTVDDGRRPETQFLGDGGIFARRPVTFSETDLGYGGTQTSASLSCEFGHFHVDSKRGQVVEIANGGKGIQEISAFTGDKPSGMRNWFKEHLPFKILKSNFQGKESLDLDNAYNGLGISMGWDSRFRRVFITKKDYIPLSPCLEYVKDEGFFFNQSQCNATPPVATCPEGYTFNTTTQLCEKIIVSTPLCPTGYTYNVNTQTCTLVETSVADCVPDINFDVTSTDWGALTTAVAWENFFSSQPNAGTTTVTNFSLVGGRVQLSVSTSLISLDLSSKNITTVSVISINTMYTLILNVNNIVNFDPTSFLPTSLDSISLTENQIVSFNPTIPLPEGLRSLSLETNDIIEFNPTTALPSTLEGLYLSDNNITNFNPTIALPSALKELVLSDNQIPVFNPTLPLPDGLEKLHLQVNNITNFNPTIALPNTMKRLLLNGNNLTSFSPTTGIPSGLQYLGLVNNNISMSSWNTNTTWINSAPNNAEIFADNSILGTTTLSLLTSKGWTLKLL